MANETYYRMLKARQEADAKDKRAKAYNTAGVRNTSQRWVNNITPRDSMCEVMRVPTRTLDTTYTMGVSYSQTAMEKPQAIRWNPKTKHYEPVTQVSYSVTQPSKRLVRTQTISGNRHAGGSI